MYEAKRVHPLVYVFIFVFVHVLFQAITNPNLELAQRAILFILSLSGFMVACVFEYVRINLEAKP